MTSYSLNWFCKSYKTFCDNLYRFIFKYIFYYLFLGLVCFYDLLNNFCETILNFTTFFICLANLSCESYLLIIFVCLISMNYFYESHLCVNFLWILTVNHFGGTHFINIFLWGSFLWSHFHILTPDSRFFWIIFVSLIFVHDLCDSFFNLIFVLLIFTNNF